MANGEVMNRVRSFLLEPTFANREGMAPEDVARRRAMAEALWSQGNSSQPVVGVFDGMNRVLQSFLGGRQMRKAEDADQFIRQRDDQQQQAGLGLMADFAYPQAGTGTGSTTPLPAAPTFNQTYNAGSQNEWAPGDFPGGDTVPNAASRIAAYGVGDGFSVEGVDQTFATGFDRAAADYIAQGGNPADIRLYDVTRSAETQAQLHANYTQQPVVWNGVTYQPNVGPGVQGLAAPPGQSRHQTGAAADIGEGPFLDWMHQNAGQYGLAFLTGNAFTNDPGHVQLAANASEGTAADGGVGQFVRELIANPQTRGVAAQIIGDQITRLTTPPEPTAPIEINGQLVDPNTRQVVGDYRDPPAPGFRDLTDPAERAARGIAADDTRTVQVGPDNQLHFTTANGSSVTPGALRTEIRQLQSYKNYYESLPIYQSMLSAAGTDNKAADLNLVYGLAKIFDPTSVVREGEQVLVRNAAGLPDQLVGWIDGLNGGGALEPSVRAAIMAQAYSRVTAYQNDLRGQLDFYGGVAQRNNIPTEDLYAPLGELRQWSPGAAGAATVPGAAAAPAAAGPTARPVVRAGDPAIGPNGELLAFDGVNFIDANTGVPLYDAAGNPLGGR